MKPEDYSVLTGAIAVLSLLLSVYNVVQALVDRRKKLKITPCRVKPVGESYRVIPLTASLPGVQGIDLRYGFLIENRGRYSLCIASIWESVKHNERECVTDIRGQLVPSTFPHSVQAGQAVLVVMNSNWGRTSDGESYIIVQEVGGKLSKCAVPTEMRCPTI